MEISWIFSDSQKAKDTDLRNTRLAYNFTDLSSQY